MAVVTSEPLIIVNWKLRNKLSVYISWYQCYTLPTPNSAPCEEVKTSSESIHIVQNRLYWFDALGPGQILQTVNKGVMYSLSNLKACAKLERKDSAIYFIDKRGEEVEAKVCVEGPLRRPTCTAPLPARCPSAVS